MVPAGADEMQPRAILPGGGKFPVLVAHRGASEQAPENTMAAFALAWQQGVRLVEGDFWLTADERIVCLHDPTTGRTAPDYPEYDVRQSSCADFVDHDVGRWKGERYTGERIPLLSEILAAMPPQSGIYVEIKQDLDRIIDVLLQTVAGSPVSLSQITIISFNASIIRRTKRLVPRLRAFLLHDPDDDAALEPSALDAGRIAQLAREVQADGVGLGNSVRVDHRYARQLRLAGLELHVWTVNSLADALRFAEMGFMSLTTDRPLALCREIEAHFGKAL